MSEDKKSEITNELMFEVLKKIQADISSMRADIHEIKAENHATRGYMVAIQTDISNLYAGQAEIKKRLERIENRLDLVNA